MFNKSKVTTGIWTEDEIGICDGGSVGGDIQISDSFSRQFAIKLDNGEYVVLRFYTYVASDDENWREGDATPEDAWVQTMVMYSHCTDLDDIGGTETHGDLRYWDGTGQGMRTAEQARELCANLTREDLSEAVNQMAI